MPGLVCVTCSHPDVRAIDAAFAAGRRAKSIATQYGLGYDTVARHKRKGHVQVMSEPAPGQPPEAAPIAPAEMSATERIRAIITELESRSVADLGPSTWVTVVQAKLRAISELTKLTGPDAPPVFDPSTDPKWIEMREQMFEALKHFPEARAAVKLVMKKFEEPK
jgi:hypothetical protein